MREKGLRFPAIGGPGIPGPPFPWPGWNTLLPGPRPDVPEQPRIKSGPAHIVEQTCGLKLTKPGKGMPQGSRDGDTHAGRSQRVRFVIPANGAMGLRGMRTVVQFQERGDLGSGEDRMGGFQNWLGENG